MAKSSFAMTNTRTYCAERYGRFKARFRPGNKILVFHDKIQVTLLDVSEVGFRTSGTAFVEHETYKFDMVFSDADELTGWRVRADCVWSTETEAGFKFRLRSFDRTLSSRIAKMHLRGAIKLLNGTEL